MYNLAYENIVSSVLAKKQTLLKPLAVFMSPHTALCLCLKIGAANVSAHLYGQCNDVGCKKNVYFKMAARVLTR